MKPSRNDPFDLNLSLRGLGNLISILCTEVYTYAYIMTFKRSMKMYKKEFYDSAAVPIEDLDFFQHTGDLSVENCMEVFSKLAAYKTQLTLILGIDEEEDLTNERIALAATRYQPYYLMFKKSKSYKRLRLYYERLLVETIECLFTYACMLTAQSYKIPAVLKKQFERSDEESLRLLNADDHHVLMISQLIQDLRYSLTELRTIIAGRQVKTMTVRKKQSSH